MERLFCLAEGPRRAWGMIGVVDKATLDDHMADFVYDHREFLPSQVAVLFDLDPATDTILEQEEIEQLLKESQLLYEVFSDAETQRRLNEEMADEDFSVQDIIDFAQSLTRLCANALIRKRKLVCIGGMGHW
ncbi:MAG: hypothetical protein ACXVP5_09635 [Tumebacillaceae bacterium]